MSRSFCALFLASFSVCLGLQETSFGSRRPFSADDDKALREAIEEVGTDCWKETTIVFLQKRGMPLANLTEGALGREIRRCRERWKHYLSGVDMKQPWKEEEDQIIITRFKEFGGKWSRIAACLEGRTDVSVKNRYYKLVTAGRLPPLKKPKPVDVGVPLPPPPVHAGAGLPSPTSNLALRPPLSSNFGAPSSHFGLPGQHFGVPGFNLRAPAPANTALEMTKLLSHFPTSSTCLQKTRAAQPAAGVPARANVGAKEAGSTGLLRPQPAAQMEKLPQEPKPTPGAVQEMAMPKPEESHVLGGKHELFDPVLDFAPSIGSPIRFNTFDSLNDDLGSFSLAGLDSFAPYHFDDFDKFPPDDFHGFPPSRFPPPDWGDLP